MNSGADYKEFYPQLECLKPYIKLYYVQHSIDEAFYEQITYFPNYNVTLNIYQHSALDWTDFSRTHSFDPSQDFLKLLVSKFDYSRQIITKGPFNKLTIVFNPLGINHFLKLPLAKLAKSHFSFFDYFDPAFESLMKQVFKTQSLEEKGSLLDAFFQNQLLDFKEHRMIHAVNRILETTGQIGVEILSEELEISRKTLLRLFKKHLDYSPSTYKSIVKFRETLISYQNARKKPNFSALAHEAAYYDQSDLNAHFKEKTGLTPNQLFSELRTIQRGLYWKLEGYPDRSDTAQK